MKYYLIAGEASGDVHGSHLMEALSEQDREAQFRFWGGDKMAEVGGEPVMHYRDIAFMGFQEVLANLKTILASIKRCKRDILAYAPDVLVLIDYPGFNMRIAKWASKLNTDFKIIYYISPQVWAWKAGRVRVLRRIVDDMYVILPFEQAFYKKYDFDVHYVGHPLLDHLAKTVSEESLLPLKGVDTSKPIVALLPGSREQEIDKILPVMLSIVPHFAGYQFIVGGVSTVSSSLYSDIDEYQNVLLVKDSSYALLKSASAALVTSGTATLETALLGVPMVVCYRTSALTYLLARNFVKIKYISLVNLIMDRPVVKELIQGNLNTRSLQNALADILPESRRRQIQHDYEEMRKILGSGGASSRVASGIIATLKS